MIFLCNRCLKAVAIVDADQGPGMDLIEVSDVFACPWCNEGEMACRPILGRVAWEHPEKFNLESMGVGDFYRAVRGMGLPGEYGAALEAVTNLFRFGRIRAIEMEEVGQPERTLIHCIHFTMPDGGRVGLHLGSSTLGATAYKITEENDGRPASDGSPGEDRAQAGPDPAPPAPAGSPAGADEDQRGDGLPSM